MFFFRKRVFFPLVIFCFLGFPLPAQVGEFKLGIDVLGTAHPELVRGKRLALLVAPTSFDQKLEHSIDRLSRAATIEVIFTGDQYFRPVVKAASGTGKIDALTNATVIEILDPLKKPSVSDFGEAEILVIDVQDIGIRYFNYVTLLAQFLDLSREANIPVIVLDRPNPINGVVVSGPVLNVDFRSQFGVYPIPLVYGMTFGELALFFNKNFGLGANLTVVGMEGYSRSFSFGETGLHWFPPSDHLPEMDSPSYYAITGFLGEIGVFSTGVGTTRPFHYVLAPWIDGELLAHRLSKLNLPGVKFLPTRVKVFYGLFQQKRVPGIEVIIQDSLVFDPVLTGLAILKGVVDLYPERIPLRNPAISAGMDTLLGGPFTREAVAKGVPVFQIWNEWQAKLKEFKKLRENFLIYPGI